MRPLKASQLHFGVNAIKENVHVYAYALMHTHTDRQTDTDTDTQTDTDTDTQTDTDTDIHRHTQMHSIVYMTLQLSVHYCYRSMVTVCTYLFCCD